jgi:hypothetical protein
MALPISPPYRAAVEERTVRQLVGRYFPELIFALKEIKTKKFVLDSEIVIPVQGSFSFDLCCR